MAPLAGDGCNDHQPSGREHRMAAVIRLRACSRRRWTKILHRLGREIARFTFGPQTRRVVAVAA